MKSQHLIALLTLQAFTTARVVFHGSAQQYTYKVPRAWDVRAGDSLVVDSPRTGLAIVCVEGVDANPRIDTEADFTYKWAVQKVDRAEHDRHRAREEEFLAELEVLSMLRAREDALARVHSVLGEGTEARGKFDAAVKKLGRSSQQ